MTYIQSHNITFFEIFSPDTPEFQQLYKIYMEAFPLVAEREEPEAFEKILALNYDQHTQSLYGPYREVVTAIRFGKNGIIIGGIIFGITTSQAHIDAGIPASIQGIYTFLSADYRGILPMRIITDYCRKKALAIYGRHPVAMREPIIFFEVNNPLRMTTEQVDEDTRHSGTDPFRRYVFWLRSLAALPLDFLYVQPGLRENAAPVHYLDLFCTNELPQGIPALLLLNHLHAFVSISVLKGRDASQDTNFYVMEQWLKQQDTVQFIQQQNHKIREIIELKKLRMRQSGFTSAG